MFKTTRFTLLQVPAPANCPALQPLPFPQQSLLQDVKGKEKVYVRSIEPYHDLIMPANILQAGLVVATIADINNAVLNLSVGGATLKYRNLPLVRINSFIPDPANYLAAMQDPFMFADLDTIDWTQSNVQTLAAAPTVTAFAYIFGVHYLYESDFENMVRKNMDWMDV